MTTPIRYHVDLSDRLHHLVRVTLTVPAALAAGARIVLPVWTPGSYVRRDYVHHVQWIRARTSGGAPVALHPDGISAWRLADDLANDLANDPGRPDVEVELELYANELTVRTNHVDDHHALLIPAATFPYVQGAEHHPHEVHLPPDPREHRVHALLPPGDEPDTYRAEDLHHLVDSAFEVGDFPCLDFEVARVPHRLVWAGHSGTQPIGMLRADLEAIGRAAVALFEGDLPAERYTFLVTAWDQGGGGLEHRDGSVIQIPARVFQSEDLYARLQVLLAHEYLHLWNVKRLTPAGLVRPDYEHPVFSESLWVAEGFTSHYDELLCVRAGVWSVRRYLDAVRDNLQRVEDLPGVALQPLLDASRQAWTKHYIRDENTPNAGTDYYGHGALVAWWLDLRLRARHPTGGGLDTVLRELWRRHANRPEGYTEQDVEQAVREVGTDELAAELRELLTGTKLPPVRAGLHAVGLRIESDEPRPAPHLGVRIRESDRGVVLASVLRDRPAWQAGLSGGDRLIAIDGHAVGRGELTAALHAFRAGEQVPVTVVRGPRLLTVPVTLGAPRPRQRLVPVDEPTAEQRQAFRNWTGRPINEARPVPR